MMQNHPTASTVTIDQTTISYFDSGGHKPVLLFFHGLGCNAMFWHFQWHHFKATHRCITIDLPGHGASTSEGQPLGLIEMTELLSRFIETQALTSVTVVGHSMGGQLALLLALRARAVIDKVILLASAGIEQFTPSQTNILKSSVSLLRNQVTNQYHWHEILQHGAYKPQKDTLDFIERMNDFTGGQTLTAPATILHCINSMLESTLEDFFSKIDQPVLMIYGKKDQFIPNKLMHFMTIQKMATDGCAKFPRATLHLLDKTGHFPHIEAAKKVNKLIEEFLLE